MCTILHLKKHLIERLYMKSYELLPTHENLMNIFLFDTIKRNKDVFDFSDILNSLEDSCSIAIDGNWGSGKTFFVHQVKMFLDATNDFVQSLNEDDKASIISEWKRLHGNSEPEYQPHVSVYYDAWENDSDSDPVLSLIYSILKKVDEDFSIPNNAEFIKTAADILEFFTNKNWNALIDSFRSEDPLDELRKSKTIEEEVKRFLDTLLEERGNRLVVFIDELDRCKPSYAVKLLERIKHYFSNDRITFVFSINANELQHTIKRYYGDDFDACRYLDRFFDLRVSLPPVNMEDFYRSIDFNSSTYLYDIMCNSVIKRYSLSIRESAKYLRLAKIAAYDAVHDNNKNHSFMFPEGKGIHFCLSYIVPIALGLKIVDSNKYERFISGKDSSPLLEFVKNIEYFSERFLDRNESYESNENGLTTVTVEEKIEKIYEAIFISTYDDIYRIKVGELDFTRHTKELVMRATSLLSPYRYIE